MLGPADDALPNTSCCGGAPSGRGSLVPGSQTRSRGVAQGDSGADARARAAAGWGFALHLRAAGRLASTDARLAREPVVIKSVHCLLALDWLAPRFRPSTLIVMRNPLNVLASFRDLEMRDQDRDLGGDARVRERVMEPRGIAPLPPTADPLERAAWQLGLFMTVLTDAAERHAWPVVWHEEVCVDPAVGFERLGKEMGIGWSDAGDEFVRSSDRPGGGSRSDERQASSRIAGVGVSGNKMPIRSTPCSTCSPRGSLLDPRPGLDEVASRAVHPAEHRELVGSLVDCASVQW